MAHVVRFFIFTIMYFTLDVVIGKDLFCPAERDTTVGSGLLWNITSVNSTTSQPCPPGASGHVTRECKQIDSLALWEEPDVSKCLNNEFLKLYELAISVEGRSPVMDSMIDFLYLLSNATLDAANNQTLYPSDIKLGTSWMLSAAANTGTMGGVEGGDMTLADYTQAFSEAASSLSDNSTLAVWDNFNDHKQVSSHAQDLMSSMDIMAASLLLQDTEQNQSAYAENIEFEMVPFVTRKTRHKRNILNGNARKGSQDEINYVELKGNGDDAIILMYPYEVLRKASEAKNILDLPVFGLYRAEYSTMTTLLHAGQDTLEKDNRTLTFNSPLLAAEVLGVEDSNSVFNNLTNPVIIIFSHDKLVRSEDEPICMFIKHSTSSDDVSELWDDTGCVTAEVNSTHTTCYCYHLTNFALLIDLYHMDLDETHTTVLTFITFVGGALSLIGCLLSIIIYIAFRLNSERIKIHQMLALSIVLVQCIFFAGFERTSIRPLCQTMAVLLHYCLTSMFCWMLVEGIHLYLSLVKVFRRNSHFNKYLILGWGVPLVSVAVSLAVFFDEYAVGDCCWMSTKLLCTGFLPFICLTLAVNTVILIMVLRVMMRSLRSRHEDFVAIKTCFKATLILLPLLGLTWVFGFMSVGNKATLIFTYLFTICNTLQGLFFFIFHCALNPDVRQALSYRFSGSEALNSHPTGSPKEQIKAVQLLSDLKEPSTRRRSGVSKDENILQNRISTSSIDSSETSQTNMEDSDMNNKESPEDSNVKPDVEHASDKYLKEKRNLYVKLRFAEKTNMQPENKETKGKSRIGKERRSAAFRDKHRPPTPTPEKKHIISNVPGVLTFLEGKTTTTTAAIHKSPMPVKREMYREEMRNIAIPRQQIEEPCDNLFNDVIVTSDMSDVSIESDCINHM